MFVTMAAVILAANVPLCVPREIHVSDGTRVPIKLMEFISSETSQPGDPVRFAVTEDVVVSGVVVIRRGTTAVGRIAEAIPYRVHWFLWWTRVHPGRLSIAVTATTASNGEPIRLRLMGATRHGAPTLIRWEHEGELFDAAVDGNYVLH